MDLNLNIDVSRFSLSRLANLVDREGLIRLGLFRPQYPPLAMEVDEGRLTLVKVDRERKQAPAVRRFRTVDLPEGALRVQFGRANLRNPAQVAQAVQEILREESIEARELSLVLPDHLARVSLIHLAERPAGRAETLEMIRWKLRKAIPFRIEDAHIDFQLFPIPEDGGASTCLATLMQQSVLEQYEELFRQIDLHPGLIDLSTFSLLNLYLPVFSEEEGDLFVLNVTGSFFALAILRRGVPLFYRAKSFAFVDDASRESRGDLVIREVSSSVSYYRERLAGSNPGRLFLRCVDLDRERTARALKEKIGAEVLTIDPSEVIEVSRRDGGMPDHGAMLQRIAPAVGAALGRDL